MLCRRGARYIVVATLLRLRDRRTRTQQRSRQKRHVYLSVHVSLSATLVVLQLVYGSVVVVVRSVQRIKRIKILQ